MLLCIIDYRKRPLVFCFSSPLQAETKSNVPSFAARVSLSDSHFQVPDLCCGLFLALTTKQMSFVAKHV